MACIIAVYLAVSIGGITRLAEAGLSITEWKPVSGIFPPRNEAGWNEEFAKFQQIPQASATHAGITMQGFKAIYWWEWFHRIAARGVGLVFALPFLYFLARGMIPPRFRLRLAWLPLLTVAQGALGWYMVSSGLSERTEVSAYRLAAHLALALAILVIALWTRAELAERDGAAIPTAPPAWRRAAMLLAGMIAVTIVTGAFVAGLRAGRMFNTFPLMGGQVVPPGYSQFGSWWTNAFENPIAAQFHHRILAVLTGIAALIAAWRAGSAPLSPQAVRAFRIVGGVVLVQVALGITTLITAVPITLGVLHQFVGVVALTAVVLAVFELRRGSAVQRL